jgi:hypothetical protein
MVTTVFSAVQLCTTDYAMKGREMNLELLESKVIEWAKDRLIFEQSSSLGQCDKLLEEYQELLDAVRSNDLDNIVDGIGDMMVVLTMIAHLNNKDLFTCYAAAYLSIKDRKGKMINGLFVKE